MDRFAYLILAHKSDLVLETLLKMIDDEHNDIFIHMDKKNIFFSEEQLNSLIKKSHLYFVERIKVTWGGYSQVKAVLSLIKMATYTGKYKYYHLLSGQDLPIKTQGKIIEHFGNCEDVQFIGFQIYKKKFDARINYYYLFQDIVGRNDKKFLCFIQRVFVFIQKMFHFNRNRRSGIRFAKGTNWFSITDDLARYILYNKKWVEKTFKYTRAGDEMFLQTLVYNSKYFNQVNNKIGDDNDAALRYIDWGRGEPYIFRASDLNELIDSPMMFARKFDESVDSEVISMLYDELCSGK
jgi:Core-2/I-Branching enzyme.